MRIQILKDFEDDRGRKFAKGKILSVTKSFGEELIKSEKAKAYTGDITPLETLKKKVKESKLDIDIKE